jgi:hypothetical protein
MRRRPGYIAGRRLLVAVELARLEAAGVLHRKTVAAVLVIVLLVLVAGNVYIRARGFVVSAFGLAQGWHIALGV